jgi:hypothetical protein
VFFDVFFGYPDVEEAHDDEDKGHESYHLEEGLAEIGENGLTRPKAYHKRNDCQDGKGRNPDKAAVFS